MGKLPVLSGHELIKILKKIGFEPVRQKGSHIVLVNNSAGSKRAVVVPNHKRSILELCLKLLGRQV
jgi:predicted RNA binding protein YcfA (HicA-like mRNA interferase family)